MASQLGKLGKSSPQGRSEWAVRSECSCPRNSDQTAQSSRSKAAGVANTSLEVSKTSWTSSSPQRCSGRSIAGRHPAGATSQWDGMQRALDS